MPLFSIPNSNGEDNAPFLEFNKCHNPPGPDGGRFCSAGSEGPGVSSGSSRQHAARGVPSDPLRAGASVRLNRTTPIIVDNIDEAVQLIKDGQVVELRDARAVNTLLNKLAAIAQEAARLKQKAPDYNLCNVSVAGTNLFCAEKVTTAERPEGYDRLSMPQLGGEPRPGSEAEKLDRKPWNKAEVSGADHFQEYLIKGGIKVTSGVIPAATLKATQRELVGTQVAAMMLDKGFNPAANPIFISRDNYVIDGHHRWAAVVGRDAADGRLGDSTMNFIRVDAPISEVLLIATQWSLDFGILPKSAKGDKP